MFSPTKTTRVNWSIQDPTHRNFGIIRITDFGNDKETITKVAVAVYSLLKNELRDTFGIIFDVRTATGGLASAGDFIPQFFKEHIRTGNGTMRINGYVLDILRNTKIEKLQKWYAAYERTDFAEFYTDPVQFTSDRSANTIVPVYFKPVAVFTSRFCYSGCEVFVSNMKDNGIAQIFGEHKRTGGSGSVAVSYNSFLNKVSPKLFPALPFVQEMPLAAPDFSISWQKFNRIIDSEIEDNGVVCDHLIPPSNYDILHPASWISQFYRIAKRLIPDNALRRPIH